MHTSARVTSLWRFPVKSMQGEELDASPVGEHGLAGDRAYALVDAETGKVCSAKHPRKWGALFDFHATFVEPPAPDRVPPARITFPDGTEALTTDPDLERRLTDTLGREVRLASTAPEGATLEEVWPEVKGADRYGVDTGTEGDDALIEIPASFVSPGDLFDFSAIHLITSNTIDKLQELRPETRFDVRRFRPNIVVEAPGGPGFIENDWDRMIVAIGDDVRLKVVIPTPRCVMTTLPQDDLPHDRGVLRATAEHNRIRAGGLGVLPCAGLYAAVVAGGTIRRGDPVRVEEDRAGA